MVLARRDREIYRPDARRHSRGFTWVIDAKSVITFPCPEKPLAEAGLYEIRGLAWSGKGKIKRVDVSFDGGVNWHTAELKDPVLSKALTRFTLPVAVGWTAGPSGIAGDRRYRLCAADSSQQLRKVRGSNSIYHNNAIQTWQVKPDGSIFDVQTRLIVDCLWRRPCWFQHCLERPQPTPASPVVSVTAPWRRRSRSRAGISMSRRRWRRTPCRQRHRRAGARHLCSAMRGMSRHLWRGRRPLSEVDGRRRNADQRPSRAVGRQLLAIRPDAVGLHQPGDAISRAADAFITTTSMR